MKLLDMTCPHCGAPLRADADLRQVKCEYCDRILLVDDETRRLAHAEEPAEPRREPTVSVNAAEVAADAVKKGSMLLWVLGWIFVWPVPLTVLFVRSVKLPKTLKIVLIAVLWLLIFGFAAARQN